MSQNKPISKQKI